MDLKFEVLEKAPVVFYQHSPLAQYLVDAEEDKWIKVSGFDSIKELVNMRDGMYSGTRSARAILKRAGFKVFIKTSKKDLAFYMMKHKGEK